MRYLDGNCVTWDCDFLRVRGVRFLEQDGNGVQFGSNVVDHLELALGRSFDVKLKDSVAMFNIS